MRLSRTGGGGALGLGATLFLASAFAVGEPGGFDRPSALERLEPGASVLASWTLDPTAVQGLDEAELLLSFDGGVSYPVRLTSRISPDARSIAWRVPALPTEHARIALRAGREEGADTEEVLFVSEVFSIGSAGNLPREDLFAVNGEWRTREALEGAPVRAPSSTCASPGPAPEMEPLEADDADDAGADDALTIDARSARGELPASLHARTLDADAPISTTLREATAPLRL